MKTEITLKRSHPFYSTSIYNFRKQFKDVVSMNKVYVNSDKKVYAGEWLDSKGVVNFNVGYAPDVFKTVVFID